MNQTDDLREALARAIFERGRKQGGIDPETWEVAGDEMQAWLLGHADAMIAGPFAPILAQVSALQAEVERLQKVEGEREKGRVTSSPCWSDKPEPQSVSALRVTITSRSTVGERSGSDASNVMRAQWAEIARLQEEAIAREAEMVELRKERDAARCGERDAEQTLGAWFDTRAAAEADLVPRFEEALSGYLRVCRCGGMPAEQSDAAEAVLSGFLRSYVGQIVTPFIKRASSAPCDRSGAADETRRGSAEGESTVTGAARQAPSDNPLTETKEGSEHVCPSMD